MNGAFFGLYPAGRAMQAASNAETAARRGRYQVADVLRELRVVEERVEKLVLINMAMWSLLRESPGLSEEDLARRVEEIDMRDGVADGKITRELQKCANCGRTLSRRHRRCLYCGGKNLKDSVFDGA